LAAVLQKWGEFAEAPANPAKSRTRPIFEALPPMGTLRRSGNRLMAKAPETRPRSRIRPICEVLPPMGTLRRSGNRLMAKAPENPAKSEIRPIYEVLPPIGHPSPLWEPAKKTRKTKSKRRK